MVRVVVEIADSCFVLDCKLIWKIGRKEKMKWVGSLSLLPIFKWGIRVRSKLVFCCSRRKDLDSNYKKGDSG